MNSIGRDWRTLQLQPQAPHTDAFISANKRLLLLRRKRSHACVQAHENGTSFSARTTLKARVVGHPVPSEPAAKKRKEKKKRRKTWIPYLKKTPSLVVPSSLRKAEVVCRRPVNKLMVQHALHSERAQHHSDSEQWRGSTTRQYWRQQQQHSRSIQIPLATAVRRWRGGVGGRRGEEGGGRHRDGKGGGNAGHESREGYRGGIQPSPNQH